MARAKEFGGSKTYALGDKVTVKGHGPGVIVEVGVHGDDHFKAGCKQHYGVRLESWKRVDFLNHAGHKTHHYVHPVTGATRDHAADTLGCVTEDDFE